MFLKVTVFFCFVAVAVVVVAAVVPTVDDDDEAPLEVAPFGLGLEPLATAAAFFELGTVSVAASLVI